MRSITELLLVLLGFLLFANTPACNAQVKFSEFTKIYSNQAQYIGGDEDYGYYVVRKNLGYGSEEQQYIKVSMSAGDPQVFEYSRVKADEKTCRLIDSKFINGEIIEVYSAAQATMTIKSKIYLVKRNPSDLTLKSSPKFLFEQRIFNSESLPELLVEFDSTGFYLIGQEQADPKGAYLKRFNLNMEEEWSENHSQFYPKTESAVVSVTINPSTEELIYNLNLQKCTDCGVFKEMFGREKMVKSTATGLIIYNKSGQKKVFIPQFEEALIYSLSQYYFNATDSTVTGAFITHEPGKNEYDAVKGVGLKIYKWDVTTNEVKNKFSKKLTFEDILGEEGKKYLEKLSLTDKLDMTANFPRNYISPNTYRMFSSNITQLKNGSILFIINGLSGFPEDSYRNEKINESLKKCSFRICFDADAKPTWSRFYDHLIYETNQVISSRESNRLVTFFYAKSANYLNDTYELNTTKGTSDIFGYSVQDLTTGDVLFRKKLVPIEKRDLNEMTTVNESAKAIIFALEKDAGSEPVQFAIIPLENE